MQMTMTWSRPLPEVLFQTNANHWSKGPLGGFDWPASLTQTLGAFENPCWGIGPSHEYPPPTATSPFAQVAMACPVSSLPIEPEKPRR